VSAAIDSGIAVILLSVNLSKYMSYCAAVWHTSEAEPFEVVFEGGVNYLLPLSIARFCARHTQTQKPKPEKIK
jgi:hypothetical protein